MPPVSSLDDTAADQADGIDKLGRVGPRSITLTLRELMTLAM